MKRFLCMLTVLALALAILPATGASAAGRLPYESYSFSTYGYGGHWSMDLTVKSDGSFSGNYDDSRMAGMVHYSNNFSGTFTDFTQVRDGVWSMRVSNFALETPAGKSEAGQYGITTTYIDPYEAPHVNEVWYIYEPGAILDRCDLWDCQLIPYYGESDPYMSFHLCRGEYSEGTIACTGSASGYIVGDDRRSIMEELPYFGDKNGTKLTADEARAFADALRSTGKTYERTVLADFGDGIPVLVAGERKYGYGDGTRNGLCASVCQWDGQKAYWWDGSDEGYYGDIRYATLWPEGIELGFSFYGTDVGFMDWACFYYVSDGEISGEPEWSWVRSVASKYDLDSLGIPYSAGSSFKDISMALTQGMISLGIWPQMKLDWSTWITDDDGISFTVEGGNYSQFDSTHDRAAATYLSQIGISSDKMIALLEAYAELDPASSYTYLTVDTSDVGYSKAVEAAGGKAETVYKLAEGLYYVIVKDGESYTGHLVKAVIRDGKESWTVLESGELMGQEELDGYMTRGLSEPNIQVDFEDAAKVKSGRALVRSVRKMLENVDGLRPNDAAKTALAQYIETGLSAVFSATVKGRDNTLKLSADVVGKITEEAADTTGELNDILRDAGVTLNKELVTVSRLLWSDADPDGSCQVTVDPDIAGKVRGSVQLMLGDGSHWIELDGANIDALTSAHGGMTIQVSKSGEVYAITFVDGDGKVIDRLEAPVTVGLPAASATSTVMAGYTGGSTNWGGQCDASSGTLSFDVYYSGTYEVVDNGVEINDIGNLDSETRQAISFLVSKGFMSAPDGSFSPNGTVKRYHFTKSLVGMFFALNDSAASTFTDVPRDSQFYIYVASGQEADLVKGVSDTEFAGDTDLTIEQMLTLTGRTLQDQRDYASVQDPDAYLVAFTDGRDVAEWAKLHTALSIREELVTPGGMLHPQMPVTRAQAAVILYRLFLKLHTVRPVALPLPELTVDELDVDGPEADGDDAGGVDWVVVALAAVGVAGIAAIGVMTAMAVKLKKRQKK